MDAQEIENDLILIKHELGIIKSKIVVVLLIIAQIKLQYAHT